MSAWCAVLNLAAAYIAYFWSYFNQIEDLLGVKVLEEFALSFFNLS